MLLALALAGPFAYGQLPSIAERALKRQKAKEEADARHAAAEAKQKANEEARRKANEDRQAERDADRAKAADENAAANKSRNEQVAARSAARRSSKPDPNAEQGITGPLHEKYLKKVVFTTADRLVDKVDEAEFTHEFTLGKPIYFRVYMEQTTPRALSKVAPDWKLEDLARQMFYGIRFSLDGKPPMDLRFDQFSGTRNNMTWTTWRGYFIKDSSADISSDQGGAVFREFIARASQKGLLTPGKHTLKIDIYGLYQDNDKSFKKGDDIASGEVAMTVPAGVITASNPDICISYKPGQRDAALEGQILKTALAQWKDPVNRPTYAQMADSVWKIERHPVSGIILHRSRDVVVATKGPEYCNFRGYKFQQVFEGSAYAPGVLLQAERSGYYMPCACLSK